MIDDLEPSSFGLEVLMQLESYAEHKNHRGYYDDIRMPPPVGYISPESKRANRKQESLSWIEAEIEKTMSRQNKLLSLFNDFNNNQKA